MTYYTPSPAYANATDALLLKIAIRDYLRADLSAYALPSVVASLATPTSVVDEGSFTPETATPAIMISTAGDGQVDATPDNTLYTFLLYAIDKGRGLFAIENTLSLVRKRLNHTTAVMQYFVFHPSTGMSLVHLRASGSSASTTLPAWKAEARALYLYAEVKARSLQSQW